MDTKDIDSIFLHDGGDNNLRLRPQPGDTFGSAAKLKRSELLNFEGSLFDELCIAAAEGDEAAAGEMANSEVSAYRQLKLQAGMQLVMPNKASLKRHVGKTAILRRVFYVSIPAAAALVLAFLLIRPANHSGNTTYTLHTQPAWVAMPNATNTDTPVTEANKQVIGGVGTPKSVVLPPVQPEKQAIPQQSKKQQQHITPAPNKPEPHRKQLSEPEFTDKQPGHYALAPPHRLLSSKDLLPGKLATPNTPAAISVMAHDKIDNKIAYITPPEEEQPAKTLFDLLGNVLERREVSRNQKALKEWLDKEMQDGHIDFELIMANSEAVTNLYDEKGRLISTSVVADGVKYTKQYAWP